MPEMKIIDYCVHAVLHDQLWVLGASEEKALMIFQEQYGYRAGRVWNYGAWWYAGPAPKAPNAKRAAKGEA